MSDEIKTQSGRVVGQWDGKDVKVLMKELERIRNMLKNEKSKDKLNCRQMPHYDQLPPELRTFTAYQLWGCDAMGNVLVGQSANRLETLAHINEFYGNEIAKDAMARDRK
jgi:hypothetical protein